VSLDCLFPGGAIPASIVAQILNLNPARFNPADIASTTTAQMIHDGVASFLLMASARMTNLVKKKLDESFYGRLRVDHFCCCKCRPTDSTITINE